MLDANAWISWKFQGYNSPPLWTLIEVISPPLCAYLFNKVRIIGFWKCESNPGLKRFLQCAYLLWTYMQHLKGIPLLKLDIDGQDFPLKLVWFRDPSSCLCNEFPLAHWFVKLAYSCLEGLLLPSSSRGGKTGTKRTLFPSPICFSIFPWKKYGLFYYCSIGREKKQVYF